MGRQWQQVSGKLILLGYSSRDLAHSANLAGLKALSIDYFGDYDSKHTGNNISLMRDLQRPFTAKNLAQVAMEQPAGYIVYGGNLENHPASVRSLATKHQVLGNDARALKKARNLAYMRELLQDSPAHLPDNLLHPTTIDKNAAAGKSKKSWLVKNFHSGGGVNIRWYHPGERIKKREYLQQHIEGVNLSATFLADGTHSQLLGISEQLIGMEEYGSHAFKWSGNVYPWRCQNLATGHELWHTLAVVAMKLTQGCGLKGLNTLDFILNQQGVYLLEVNPRFSASVELLERFDSNSLLPAHVAVCLGGTLSQSIEMLPQGRQAAEHHLTLQEGNTLMKVVLYAKKHLVVEDNEIFIQLKAHDIPFNGDVFRKGDPLCTLVRETNSRKKCQVAMQEAVKELDSKLYD